jgi:hypothetical protein
MVHFRATARCIGRNRYEKRQFKRRARKSRAKCDDGFGAQVAWENTKLWVRSGALIERDILATNIQVEGDRRQKIWYKRGNLGLGHWKWVREGEILVVLNVLA